MQVNVGNPPSTYDLLIDTGSANIWVGARSTYKRTRTSRDTGNHVAVKYGSGSFSGEQYIDAVTITNALKMRQQPIGGAKKASGFAEAGIDGVLGLGPRTLAQGTVDNTAMVPTVVDTLYGDHAIAWPAVGVAFAPYGAAYSTPNGALTFGGYDRTRFIGKLSWVPVTKTKPANQFWGVDQQIVYDGTVIMPQTAGILDTGTTLIYLPSDAFQKYKLAVKGAIDRDTGFLRIRNDQFKSLKPLKFALGTRTYTLSPNGQVWPRTMNAYIGGQKGYVYLMINDIGAPSGKGLDFVNGFAWSERFYSVYDTGNNGVWVADSPHGTSETN
ncbi:acid protease [Punctularia strigosozonata HHB-11173 SS5]|uniref:acid protease n=1 Tax=Punctularia strigosozonata (strain HHB-11173) TaxID=741275 RepID=UPI0004418055|nr:acid protease [Punctularia strigosozonata HHB-11173 SS5]EIN06383.1 acid protease [Punctularia strigosozonata HHB-11173 SS5]